MELTKEHFDQIVSGLASKEDLKAFATKEDIQVVREEMKSFATKEDLKTEVHGIREELKAFATKQDLESRTSDILHVMNARFDEFGEILSNSFSGVQEALDRHEKEIQKLKKAVKLA